MDILLYAPEYRPNLSNMIRSAEFFGYSRIYIYDQNGLMDPPSNKVSRADMNHMARVWTAGAIEHIEIIKVESIAAFLKNHSGRKVATVVDVDATHLAGFNFEKGGPNIHEHDSKPAQGFGLFYEGELICFYDYETDLSDGWEDESVHNNSIEIREKALQMGANIIEYAFSN